MDGLDIGADDYLTKPFAFAELVARINSLARRARPALPPVLERAGVTLDRPGHRAWRDGLLLSLTLRRKLGDPPVIETVPGAGYRLGP